MTPGLESRLRAPVDRAIHYAGVLAALLCLVVAAKVIVYCAQFALLPSTDQWRIVDRMLTRPALEFVFSEHNGHRISFANLAILVDFELFSWRNAFVFGFGAAMAIGGVAILARMMRPGSNAVAPPFIALAIALLFLPLGWRNFLDATQSAAVHPFFLFAVAAVWSMQRGLRRGQAGPVWLGAALGLLSALSFSYGILVPALGSFALAWMRRYLQAAVLFALSAAYAVWEMLPQIEGLLAGGGGAAASPLAQLGHLPVSVLSTLALALREFVPIEAAVAGLSVVTLAGLVVLVVFLVLLWVCLRRDGMMAVAPWLGLMGLALGSGCLIFAGRSSAGSLAETVALAAAPRYFIVSYLGMVALLGLAVRAFDHAPRTVARASACVAIVAALALAGYTVRASLPDATRFARNFMGQYAATYLLALSDESVSFRDRTRLWVREARYAVIERIKPLGKGPFSLEERPFIGRPVAALNGGRPIADCEAPRIGPIRAYKGAPEDPEAIFLYGQAGPVPDRFLGGSALLADRTDTKILYAGATGLHGRPAPRAAYRPDHAGFVFAVPRADAGRLAGRSVYLRPDDETPFCRVTVPEGLDTGR